MSKPLCSRGDFNQAKKWIFNKDRSTGGSWVCWEHFNRLLEDDLIAFDGRWYNDTKED